MFAEQPRPERRRWGASHLVSLAVHVVVLLAVCYRPVAVFVKPSLSTRGDRGTATVLYLAPKAAQPALVAARPEKVRLRFPTPAPPKPNSDRITQKNTQPQNAENQVDTAPAGSTFGSELQGDMTGIEVRPAIPTVFPDLPRSEVPAGVQGDVIVEITIDTQGMVIETKVLKTIGYGLEEKVVAILRNWKFRPATRDGTPIPSKQDVRIHFPS